jgi:hypothetical protein
MTFLTTGIPGWLQPHKLDAGPPYTEYTVEQVLEGLSGGVSLKQLCREKDLPPYGSILVHIHKDPKLLERYYFAQMVGAEARVQALTDLIDRVMNPEEQNLLVDVQSLQAKIGWEKFLIGKWNKRYQDTRQVDVNVEINLADAMDRAAERVARGRNPVMIEEGEVVDG